jgi:hypothetical protein
MENDWQETQSNLRTRPEWMYSRGASRDSRSSIYQVYTDVVYIKRKDRDIVGYLYNSSLVLDYLFLHNLYDSLFVLDNLFSFRV